MDEKKIMDMEDLMFDYGEMTSFDFNSMDYKEVRELQRITNSEYSDKVMELVDRIPETENDEITELRKEVVNLNAKRILNT